MNEKVDELDRCIYDLDCLIEDLRVLKIPNNILVGLGKYNSKILDYREKLAEDVRNEQA